MKTSRLCFDEIVGTGRAMLSEAVQKKLFESGFIWSDGLGQQVFFTDSVALCIQHDSKQIYRSSYVSSTNPQDDEDVFSAVSDLQAFFEKVRASSFIPMNILGVNVVIYPDKIVCDVDNFRKQVEAEAVKIQKDHFPCLEDSTRFLVILGGMRGRLRSAVLTYLQLELFKMGYEWNTGGNELLSNTDASLLYVYPKNRRLVWAHAAPIPEDISRGIFRADYEGSMEKLFTVISPTRRVINGVVAEIGPSHVHVELTDFIRMVEEKAKAAQREWLQKLPKA